MSSGYVEVSTPPGVSWASTVHKVGDAEVQA
jgi:hypothetical protein